MNSAGAGLAGAFASESETAALGMDDFGEKGQKGPSLETENPGWCELSRSVTSKLRDIARDLAARGPRARLERNSQGGPPQRDPRVPRP